MTDGAWVERPADPSVVAALEQAGQPRLLARLLAARGVTVETLRAFLDPQLRRLAAPSELPGVDQAAELLLAEVRRGGRIVVFGDYDCDGVCATAIMVRTIRALGGHVSSFLPRRLGEGYGMSEASVKRMLEENPDVTMVVTVDNGTCAVEHVAALKARGVSVIVTDHHLCSDRLPQADALVNPKIAAPKDLEWLCGAGVAYFLAGALMALAKCRGLYGGPSICDPLLVMAGLATVTDIMPLGPQNRILVAEALRRFRKPPFPGYPYRGAPAGLKELLDRSGRTGLGVMTTRDFGFALGPRINSIGRLEGDSGDATDALSLMLCDEVDSARVLAAKIDSTNTLRKVHEQRMTDMALAQVEPGAAAQVINFSSTDDHVHPGVCGIVAARVMERLGGAAPVCILVDGRGSARAPGSINVRDALAACEAQLSSFGGHAAAAGLSVRDGMLEAFRVQFRKACQAQADNLPPGKLGSVTVDAFVRVGDLTREVVRLFDRLEPFGEGNPEPSFAICGVRPEKLVAFAEGRHLQFIVDGVRTLWWTHGADLEQVRAVPAVDMVVAAGISDYGTPHVELRVLAMRFLTKDAKEK